MSNVKNLVKRGDVYYARIAIPKKLRALRQAAGVDNPRESLKSLGTSDLKIAGRLIASFLHGAYSEFAADEHRLRAGGVRPLTIPSAHDLERAQFEFRKLGLWEDEQDRIHRKTVAEVEAMAQKLAARHAQQPFASVYEYWNQDGLEYEVARDQADLSSQRRACEAQALEQHLAEANYVLVSDVVEDLARTNGWKLHPSSPEYKALARGLIRARLDVLKSAKRRDAGKYDPDRSQRNKLSTMSAFGKWLEQNADGVEGRSIRQSQQQSGPIASARSRASQSFSQMREVLGRPWPTPLASAHRLGSGWLNRCSAWSPPRAAWCHARFWMPRRRHIQQTAASVLSHLRLGTIGRARTSPHHPGWGGHVPGRHAPGRISRRPRIVTSTHRCPCPAVAPDRHRCRADAVAAAQAPRLPEPASGSACAAGLRPELDR